MPLTPVDNDPFATPAPSVKSGKLTPVDHDPFAPAPAAESTPWASWGDPRKPDKIGEFVNTAIDSGTMGAADVLQGWANKLWGGKTVDQMRAQTEAARADIGPLAAGAADVTGYMVGPGKLKAGAKIAELMGGKLAARIVGSAAEGGGSAVLGTLEHGDTNIGDNIKALMLGGGLGAATGWLPGGRGPAPKTPPSADLFDTASGLYTPLKDKVYPPVYPATVMTNVDNALDKGLKSKMSGNLADQIARVKGIISDGGNVTANDIAGFQSSIGGAARNKYDPLIAGEYGRAFDRGVGSKTAADIAAANRASNIAQTGSEIEGWAADPRGAPAAVKKALADNPNFYKTQPGLFEALNKIGSKADAPSWGRDVVNHLISGGIGAAAGEGIDYFTGDHRGLIGGALLGATMPKVRAAVRAGPVKGGLLAAGHLNATGNAVDPGVYTAPWLQNLGEILRKSGYAAGSSGAL